MWSVCFGFLTALGMDEHKSPKETTAYIFALSSSQNYPLMFWISKYLFPGAVMRGCTRNQVTQLTKKSLKLQPFVFILLKYLHCDANADFQSKKKYLFLAVKTVVGSKLNSKCSHWTFGFLSPLVFCKTLKMADIKWAAFLFYSSLDSSQLPSFPLQMPEFKKYLCSSSGAFLGEYLWL